MFTAFLSPLSIFSSSSLILILIDFIAIRRSTLKNRMCTKSKICTKGRTCTRKQNLHKKVESEQESGIFTLLHEIMQTFVLDSGICIKSRICTRKWNLHKKWNLQKKAESAQKEDFAQESGICTNNANNML